MKAFVVYCHTSEDSFTRHVRDSFIKGIEESGNEYVLSDLYKMNFKTDMSEQEYLRDSMKKVMINDRIFDRAKKSDFVIFPGMTREFASREEDWDKNLKIAYEKGKNFFK
ncbi:MAG: NAD(P)H-dependent oxidoreductase [Treponema sp.]|nr:NAD(P)H-dependent oxidoreductase [Treponema sp.]